MLTLWYNGIFYIKPNVFAQAILVKNNKIVEVGSNDQLFKKKFDNKIDLKNQLVLPGFIDTHTHFLKGQNANPTLDLSQIETIENLINITQKFLNTKQVKQQKVCYGIKLNYPAFKKINRFVLDQITTEIPIIFITNDLHTTICNTKALVFNKLFVKNIVSSIGGKIVLDKQKMPTGVLKEEAQFLLNNFISVNEKQNLKNLNKLVKKANQLGITSINTCDLIDNNKLEIFELYNKFVSNNKAMRFFHQCYIKNTTDFQNFLKLKFQQQKQFNEINTIKLFIDGSLTSQTAYVSEYQNKKLNIQPKFTKLEFLKLCKLINSYNYPIATHAIGDLGAILTLNVYQKLTKPLRNSIIHLQIATPKVIDLLKKTQTLAIVQPIFINDDICKIKTLLNRSLTKFTYNFKTLLNHKIPISFSTDFPVASLNPWNNIYCALTQKQLPNQKPTKILNETEKLNIDECIAAYTTNAAYASFSEKKLGKIAKNYLADFIVLNQNIFKLQKPEMILKTKIKQTIVNGKIVYQEPK